MSVKLPNGLTAQEEEFAQGLARKMSQRAAYYAAGYKAATDKAADNAASRLAKNVGVATRVAELIDKAARGSVLSAQFVHQTTFRIITEGLKPLPVVARNGDIIGEKCADLPAATSATKLAAQLLGMLIDRHQVELSEDARKALDNMIAVITTEVTDPDTRNRIIARLSGESQAARTS